MLPYFYSIWRTEIYFFLFSKIKNNNYNTLMCYKYIFLEWLLILVPYFSEPGRHNITFNLSTMSLEMYKHVEKCLNNKFELWLKI